MRMGIGLGVGINRSNYAQGIFGAYATRVVADGGVVEGGACVDAVSSLLQSASLLLIPSGYKGGKLYAEIPTNGNGDLTWTRGSDAFRTNASGVLQRVPWNLVQQSETFANAVWTAGNSTITANTTNAPNGTLTADTIASTTIGSETRIRQTIVQGANITFTLSCYAKKGSVNWFIVRNLGVNASAGRAWFNLNTGTIGTVNSGLTASIENVGDGWYRCSVTGVSTGAGNLIDFAPALSDAAINATSVGESVFIWGAQLVEGTTAQTYLPTTDRLNFPRLSYMYGSCPAVLLEPQRTNVCLQSENYDVSLWIKGSASGGSTPIVTLNYGISPSGLQNASRVQLTRTSTAGSYSYLYQALTVTSGVSYTWSVWLKSLSGTPTIALVKNGSYTNIVTLTTDWKRYEFTATSSSTSVECCFLIFQTLGTTSLSADFLAWGFQLEAGAYPTTYISTTSATATRVADSAVKTGISSLIGQSEGTIFVDFYVSGIGANNINIYNNDRTPSTISTNAIVFKPNGSIDCQTFLGNGTYASITISASTYSVGQRIKLAYRYKSGDFAVYINGIQKATATNTLTFVGTKSQIYLDDNAVIYGYQEAVHYNQFALFTTALTNAKLIELTTL